MNQQIGIPLRSQIVRKGGIGVVGQGGLKLITNGDNIAGFRSLGAYPACRQRLYFIAESDFNTAGFGLPEQMAVERVRSLPRRTR